MTCCTALLPITSADFESIILACTMSSVNTAVGGEETWSMYRPSPLHCSIHQVADTICKHHCPARLGKQVTFQRTCTHLGIAKKNPTQPLSGTIPRPVYLFVKPNQPCKQQASHGKVYPTAADLQFTHVCHHRGTHSVTRTTTTPASNLLAYACMHLNFTIVSSRTISHASCKLHTSFCRQQQGHKALCSA